MHISWINIFNLHEDKLSGSKHVEDIKKLNILI